MKKEFLKRVMATGMVAAMALSAAACGSSDGGSKDSATNNPPADETKEETPKDETPKDEAPADETPAPEASGDYEECNLSISWWGGDDRHNATQEAVKAFEAAYPGITVDVTFGAWDGWEEKMATAFSAGTAQDVNQINWNWITQYDNDGSRFLNLDDYKDIIDLSQIDSQWVEMCRAGDGSLAALPVSMTGRIFYWDKTTFDEIGADIPTDLDSLKAAGEAFAAYDDSYYPLAMGEYDRMILMVHYLESIYGKEWVTGNTLNYSKEEIVEGLNFISDLEASHVIPTLKKLAGDGAGSLDQNQNWIDGHYAGIWEWDSSASKFSKAAEGREIIVGDEFPFGDHQGGFAKVSMCWAISATTAHPKEAAMLVEYLMNSEEAAKILTSQRGIPVSKSALAASQADLDATTVEANGKVLSWVSYSLDPKFEDASLKNSPDGVYYDAMAGLSYEDYSAEEAADVLIEGINAAIQ